MCSKKKLVVLLLTSIMSVSTWGQLGDLARIDYTILPSSADFEFNRLRFLFNYPIKLDGKQSYLFLGLDYSNINVIYGSGTPRPFDIEDLNGFQLLDLNIAYTQKLRNDWRLGLRFTPGISSNLRADELTFDDVFFSGDAVFIKDKKDDTTLKRPYRLILGVSYSQNRGFPFPLPFVSYYRKFHPNWSFNLGVPKTNLQYHFSKQNRLKLFAQLDGFTSNIQSGVTLDNGVAEQINMSLILTGLQYEYHIGDHVEFSVRTSYILDRNVNLRDSNNDDLLLIDDSNGLSLRAVLRFKI
ncbi:hypothetical protein MTsPCn5_14880 [Croceitalea sp. MTPC5]|nr:hypothetical protein MTsPCn5_14880 [Croceitalea sp. MTPC5]